LSGLRFNDIKNIKELSTINSGTIFYVTQSI